MSFYDEIEGRKRGLKDLWDIICEYDVMTNIEIEEILIKLYRDYIEVQNTYMDTMEEYYRDRKSVV